MTLFNTDTRKKNGNRKEKILLVLFPFWTPLLPPLGICRLKAYLQRFGYTVKTVDTNLEIQFKELYDNYFVVLKKNIPFHKRGNFYNIGNDVWRDHMMAHINRTDEAQYIDLVKILINQTFFYNLDDSAVYELVTILEEFFRRLECYLLELLEREKPEVFGVSVYRDTLAASLFAFQITRKRYPYIKNVMGGSIFSQKFAEGIPNFDLFLEKTKDYIDKVMIGPGEQILHQYLEGLLPEKKRWYTLKDIQGAPLAFTSLDMPDISDFNPGIYYYLGAQASSGCPYHCSFCNASGFGTYREKSAAQVVEEMIKLHRKYNSQLFFMLDALLNNCLTGMAHEFIKAGVMLYYDGYLRVDDAASDIEMTLLWRRGGFYRARIGIESGSQHVLDLMGKKITIQQSKTTIANLAYAGIKTTAYLVVGHPGETEEDFRQTLDFVEELKNDIWEVECNVFNYLYIGQNNDEWADKRILLYPEYAKDMLIFQTWIVDSEPRREVMYERMNRLVQYCGKLGIPNPYSFSDIQEADARWKKLHENAVPSIWELKKENYIDDKDTVKQFIAARKGLSFGEFDF